MLAWASPEEYTVLLSTPLSYWISETQTILFYSVFIICLCHFLGAHVSSLPSSVLAADPLLSITIHRTTNNWLALSKHQRPCPLWLKKYSTAMGNGLRTHTSLCVFTVHDIIKMQFSRRETFFFSSLSSSFIVIFTPPSSFHSLISNSNVGLLSNVC